MLQLVKQIAQVLPEDLRQPFFRGAVAMYRTLNDKNAKNGVLFGDKFIAILNAKAEAQGRQLELPVNLRRAPKIDTKIHVPDPEPTQHKEVFPAGNPTDSRTPDHHEEASQAAAPAAQ